MKSKTAWMIYDVRVDDRQRGIGTVLVKKAIASLRAGSSTKATETESAISDPAARKLVEWIILRSPNNGAESTRYRGFIAANPSWPSLALFRRRAEEMLWVEQVKPAQVLSFFQSGWEPKRPHAAFCSSLSLKTSI